MWPTSTCATSESLWRGLNSGRARAMKGWDNSQRGSSSIEQIGAPDQYFSPTTSRRILKSYARYYNETRTHLALDKDAPLSRTVKRGPDLISDRHRLVDHQSLGISQAAERIRVGRAVTTRRLTTRTARERLLSTSQQRPK